MLCTAAWARSGSSAPPDDFLGCLAGARGQLTHLVGYYGEAAALIAGASSFDGGVERQQVGLIGDPADGLENGTDQLRLLVQRLDAIGSLLHLLGNAMHHIDGLLDHLGAALGTEIGVVRGVIGDGRGLGDGQLAVDLIGDHGGELDDLVELAVSIVHRVVEASSQTVRPWASMRLKRSAMYSPRFRLAQKSR